MTTAEIEKSREKIIRNIKAMCRSAATKNKNYVVYYTTETCSVNAFEKLWFTKEMANLGLKIESIDHGTRQLKITLSWDL
jgi:hypothetical protein